MTKHFHHAADLPEALPVFPLEGVILLPRARLPLNIFEPRYLAMVEHVLGTKDRLIVMAQPSDPAMDVRPGHTGAPSLYNIGCAGRVMSFMETDDGRYLISLEGVSRVMLKAEPATDTPYRIFETDFTPYEKDLADDAREGDMNREGLMQAVRNFVTRHNLSMDWDALNKTDGEALVNSLSLIAPFGPREKQALLEADSVVERTETLIALTEMALASEDEQGSGSLQ